MSFEFHPFLELNSQLSHSRIILGSFTTYNLTEGKTEKEIIAKEQIREQNNEFLFFYGSKRNRFWSWYKTYVDSEIDRNNKNSIIKSLSKNNIGITDMIKSCQRKNKSALDKHLINRSYNVSFIPQLKTSKSIKILCTSKGVLNDMLKRHYLDTIESINYSNNKSIQLQANLLNKIKGESSNLKQPIAQVYLTKSKQNIECVSLPSPGSPYRRLIDFGYIKSTGEKGDEYLQRYLQIVFKWFLS